MPFKEKRQYLMLRRRRFVVAVVLHFRGDGKGAGCWRQFGIKDVEGKAGLGNPGCLTESTQG